MYLETIDEKAFRSFLSNPAISVLDGNVLDKYHGSNFYRFVRVPLSDGGEHHVDAIFGNMYSTYDRALNAHRFSASGNLEFMAYLVDYKDTYNESYQFRTLFGGSVSTEDGSFHSARTEMAKSLYEYLEKTTVLEPEYLEDPDRNKLAYVKAVDKYVYAEEEGKMKETFSRYFKRFDDTLTVEFLAHPSHWAENVVAELDKRTELYDGLNFSAGSGKELIAVQRLVEQYIKQFESDPNCWESEYKKLLDAVSGCKNVRLILEGDGKQLSVQYPVSDLKLHRAVMDKQISTFPISPIKTRNEVQKFVNSIFPKVDYSIPIKMVSRVESGRKVLWENPYFEKN